MAGAAPDFPPARAGPAAPTPGRAACPAVARPGPPAGLLPGPGPRLVRAGAGTKKGGGLATAAPDADARSLRQASCMAALTFSAVIGHERTRAPTAAWMALAMAGPTTVTTGSPVPAG